MTEIDIDNWRAKLGELETKLSRYPHVIDALAPPATERQIRNASTFGRYSLPEWVKELYRWHNGADLSIASIFEFPFFSIDRGCEYYDQFATAGGEFGWYRPFFFPIAGVDMDFLLITLDSADGRVEPSVMWWCLEDFPSVSHRTPFEWIDSLLWKLDYIDEDSFSDDGRFLSYDRSLWPASGPPTDETSPTPRYDGTRYREWSPEWRERAGIDHFLISDAELPPHDERELPRVGRSRLPARPIRLAHPGPWNIQFNDMGTFNWSAPGESGGTTLPKPDPPWELPCGFLLPDGVVTDQVREAGHYLEAVVWLEPDTLGDERPVIEKVRFPMPNT